MSDNFFHILLMQIPATHEEMISEICFRYGATGVSEELKFTQDSFYEPHIERQESLSLNIYFDSMPSHSFFDEVKIFVPQVRIEVREEQQKDWLEEWKKGYVPFQISGPYWVVPSWITPPPEAKIPIIIDPGMAFGTGTHATTKVASELIVEIPKYTKQRIQSAIDVGTGTGILAMLAFQEGISKVWANEIDPEARRVARENLQLNSLTKIRVIDEQIDAVDDQFDLLIANIIDGVLLQLKPDLLRLSGKFLILSGILIEREEQFRREFEADAHLQLLERRQKDEWIGLLYQKSES